MSVKLSMRHLETFFGFDRALDISTDRVRGYISHRQGEKASNASINRELAALKRMFSLGIQAGNLSSKPYVPMLEENNARQGFFGPWRFSHASGKLTEVSETGNHISLSVGLAC